MTLFSMIIGNAFAAFPVMTAGIALPFLVHTYDFYFIKKLIDLIYNYY